MGTIVAIGGGDIRDKSTLAIDKEIVKLSKKKHPKFLFIPTASSDNETYWKIIDEHFTKLGCKTEVLFLLSKILKEDIARKIASADIIYVGGGNTLMMMKRWRKLAVDVLLRRAWKNNKVLCGISAGSICWFDSGHSDSLSFYNPKKWKYINVRGLGLVPGVHCPHYNSQTLGVPRKKEFKKMIKKIGGMGIAIDNSCAIVFEKNKYRVIQAKKNANAYKVYEKRGEVTVEFIKQGLIKNLYRIKTNNLST